MIACTDSCSRVANGSSGAQPKAAREYSEVLVSASTNIATALAVYHHGAVSVPVDSERATWNLDLGAYYPIKFTENMQLRLSADWFNVTNTQRAIFLDQTQLITLGVAGTPNVPNPFFGSGQIFQYPSAFRLGAKFSF